MKNSTQQILLHITGCIAFLSLPVLLSPDISWNFDFVRMRPFQEDFISYTLLLLFFYLNYFYLLPLLYFRKKFIRYLFCILVSYAVVVFLPHMMVPGNHRLSFQPQEMAPDLPRLSPAPDSFFQQQPTGAEGKPPTLENGQSRHKPHDFNTARPHRGRSPDNRSGFLSRIPRFEYFFQFMMVLVLSTIIQINNRLKQAEKEKVNAELSYLKAQINPHFLFNTLNSIYSSAIAENADNTASAVVKLSGMMRYVISEAHHVYVPLEKELGYISDYIELQKIRLGSTVRLRYDVTGNTAGKQIAPLILISFIENAFKHGVNPEENSSIEIEIDMDGNALHLSVLNNKVKTVVDDSSKNNVGIENTVSRLQLLYPSRHELAIKNDEKEFLVLLKIMLA